MEELKNEEKEENEEEREYNRVKLKNDLCNLKSIFETAKKENKEQTTKLNTQLQNLSEEKEKEKNEIEKAKEQYNFEFQSFQHSLFYFFQLSFLIKTKNLEVLRKENLKKISDAKKEYFLSCQKKNAHYCYESKKFSLPNSNKKDIALEKELFFLNNQKKSYEINLQVLEDFQKNLDKKDYMPNLEKEISNCDKFLNKLFISTEEQTCFLQKIQNYEFINGRKSKNINEEKNYTNTIIHIFNKNEEELKKIYNPKDKINLANNKEQNKISSLIEEKYGLLQTFHYKIRENIEFFENKQEKDLDLFESILLLQELEIHLNSQSEKKILQLQSENEKYNLSPPHKASDLIKALKEILQKETEIKQKTIVFKEFLDKKFEFSILEYKMTKMEIFSLNHILKSAVGYYNKLEEIEHSEDLFDNEKECKIIEFILLKLRHLKSCQENLERNLYLDGQILSIKEEIEKINETINKIENKKTKMNETEQDNENMKYFILNQMKESIKDNTKILEKDYEEENIFKESALEDEIKQLKKLKKTKREFSKKIENEKKLLANALFKIKDSNAKFVTLCEEEAKIKWKSQESADEFKKKKDSYKLKKKKINKKIELL